MNNKELLATKIEGDYKSPLKNCSCYNQKLNKLQSNWNSLREWLLEKAKGKLYFTEYDEILDKMNELEGVDNESN